MGLDIYLYSAADREQNERHETEWNALWERKESGEINESAFDEQVKLITPYTSSGEVPSELYPDHLFNRRYLRSSYNGGGFNRAVPDMLGEAGDLYWIFEPMGREWDGDEGHIGADDVAKLRECRERALTVAEKLRKADRLRAMTVDAVNPYASPPTMTDSDALAAYRVKIADGAIRADGWWSSRDMDVFGTEGVTILAAVAGRSVLGTPALHLIYRASDAGFDSYVQAAEIVAEFCDEAIALIEKDGSARLSWSG